MESLRKYGFAILLGLSILVILLVGIFWVFMNARSYAGQASGLTKIAGELKGFAQRSKTLPTPRLLDASRKHRQDLAGAADQAADYLKNRMAKFKSFFGSDTPPDTASFMSRYTTEVTRREKDYRAKFPLKSKQGVDVPILPSTTRRTSVSAEDLPLAMKELYMVIAILDAAIKHDVGGLSIEFVRERKGPSAPSAPSTAGAAGATAPLAPLHDTVKARLVCRARWTALFAFLDALYGDETVPFEVTRLVVGKSYESLQAEKDAVKPKVFDTKEKASQDPGAGPDPALEVLELDLVGYDWKGEPPAAPPAKQ